MELKDRALQDEYLKYAASDHAAASGEALENVRRKHLTSAATWEGLARLTGKIAAAREAGRLGAYA